MRPAPTPEVERWRIEGGRGERYGAFRPPGLGTPLLIIISDGTDWEKAGLDGPPWEHVSVSCKSRIPTWLEMEWVREQFFADDELVLQFSVPRKDHININSNVLHLWRPVGVDVPLPPRVTV